MAIKSAVTVSLVEEARGGPFVFWDGLADAAAKAASLGYDAIEIFAPSATAVDRDELRQLLEQHNIEVAAVGTGAGMVKHGLSLSDPDAAQREKAIDFIRGIIDFGGEFKAPAIIGSMQGRWTKTLPHETALGYLAEACQILGDYAQQYDIPLIYEPLNRYETNLVNTVEAGVEFLQSNNLENVKLLADLFHMNIEETNLADAIRAGAGHIGHVHFVDSNRRPAGLGHMDYAPIAAALKETYSGYASAEAFPYPSPDEAAKQTIEMYRNLFGE